MKLLLLIISIPVFNIIVCAQSDIESEEFRFSFIKTSGGGRFLYSGRNHSFTVDIISDSFATTEYPNYVRVDNHIVQTSIVSLPPVNLDLNNLSVEQQKQLLESYTNYELNYFKNDLHLTYTNLKKQWVTENAKLWLIWSFDFQQQQTNENTAKQAERQIYCSTICFNQVLDLNIPLFRNDDFQTCETLVKKIMGTLKLMDKHL